MNEKNPITDRWATVVPVAREELHAFAPRVLPPGWRARDIDDGETLCFESATTRVLMSVAYEEDGRRWMHLSVSKRSGNIPRWDELVDVRDLFAGRERLAVHIIAPASEHYDVVKAGHSRGAPEVMHLWIPIEHEPLPNFLRARGGTL